MANKLDLEKRLFVGPTAVREGTVVDNIRKAVSELDTGEGVTYADLEAHMLKNFAPGKSQNYSASYIKSYVRDGVNKYNHLSHNNEGHEYNVLATPERAPRAPRSSKGPRVSKAQSEKTEALAFIRDQGQVADASDLDSTQITSEDFAAASGRKQKTIDKMIQNLETEGLVRTEQREGNADGDVVTYVFLTPAGYAQLNEAVPEGAGSEETVERQEAAEAVTEDTSQA